MDLFRGFFDKSPSGTTASPAAPEQQTVTSTDSQKMDPHSSPPPTKSNVLVPVDDSSTLGESAQPNGSTSAEQHQEDASRQPQAAGFFGFSAQEAVPLGRLQAEFPVMAPQTSPVRKKAGRAADTLGTLSPKDGQAEQEQAVPLGQPSSAENISLLYQVCNNRRVTPDFGFVAGFDDMTWTCTLTIDTSVSIASTAGIPSQMTLDSAGHNKDIWEEWDKNTGTGTLTVQDRTCYATKKMAKEHVAELALPILRRLPEARKNSPQPLSPGPPPAAPEENWIGRLLEFCNATGTPQAMYQEFKTGSGFACELIFQPRPGHVFGSRDDSFPNKKSAKAAAAREAVRWLRDTGRMTEMERKRKSKKKPASPGPTGQPQNGDAHDSKRLKTSQSSGVVAAASSIASAGLSTPPKPLESISGADKEQGKRQGADSDEYISYTKKVRVLCAAMGMKEPMYHTTPNPNAPLLYSVTATFTYARDLAKLHLLCILPHGQASVSVKNIKVKAQALDACAHRVYGLLVELQNSLQAAELAGLSITTPPSAAADAVPDSIARASPSALPGLV